MWLFESFFFTLAQQSRFRHWASSFVQSWLKLCSRSFGKLLIYWFPIGWKMARKWNVQQNIEAEGQIDKLMGHTNNPSHEQKQKKIILGLNTKKMVKRFKKWNNFSLKHSQFFKRRWFKWIIRHAWTKNRKVAMGHPNTFKS